jgi:ribosome-associated protein
LDWKKVLQLLPVSFLQLACKVMDLELLKKELTFKTARSSGPGGQNVNKVETKVELRFDVQNSRVLEEAEKQLILTNLSNRINAEGILLLTNQTSRSQLDNKEAVIAEFCRLLEQATTPPKKRKKVKPLTADREKRLSTKKRDSEKKSLRSKVSLP